MLGAFPLLLHGLDTVQCSYYLAASGESGIDWHDLELRREELRNGKRKECAPIILGNSEFLLAPHGTKTGFPFLITNSDFKIEMGRYNNPNFSVTFRSEALWRDAAVFLNNKFLKWAASVGYYPAKDESLSRLDYCFDFHLPQIDFDENSFLSRADKDAQYRENGKLQTLTFGKGDIVLRVYDKVAEIKQQSEKVWFYTLWGRDSEVWRVEWQMRKQILKRFGICTFADLDKLKGDALRYLAEENTTLRIPSGDSNPSRWPLHPLWISLQDHIRKLPHLGVLKVYCERAALEERRRNLAESVYGYLKRVAAIHCVQNKVDEISLDEVLSLFKADLKEHHEKYVWSYDVAKRKKEIELGQW